MHSFIRYVCTNLFLISLLIYPIGIVSALTMESHTIVGKVTDAAGDPLVGVSILVKGKSVGTTSDLEGSFSLNTEKNSVLVFSYIGYKNKEVRVVDSRPLNVVLEEDTKQLGEVVVVGYGSQKKATITGSVDAITGEDMNIAFSSNTQNMLTGKLSGVSVRQNSSEPGSFNTKINIRGLGQPLVVIDGMISSLDVFNRLSASEIENVSVLKDASASVYGMKAGNGVLLVTTRKGSNTDGKPTIEYSMNMGFSKLINLNKPMSAYDYALLKNDVNKNMLNPANPLYDAEQLEQIRNTPGLDVYKAVMRDSNPIMNHNLAVSGSVGQNNKVQYFLSANYMKEYGLYKSGDLSYDRYNLRSNISADLGYGFNASVNMAYMRDNKNAPYDGEVYKDIWGIQPVDESGNVLTSLMADDEKGYYLKLKQFPNNPLASSRTDAVGYANTLNKHFSTNLSLSWDVPFLKGLQAKFVYAFEEYQMTGKRWQKALNLYDYDAQGNLMTHQMVARTNLKHEYDDRTVNNMQAMLTYENTFNSVHNLKILALFEQQKNDNPAGFSALRYYQMDSVDELFAGMEDDQRVWGTAPVKEANQGLVGRVNYDYAGKYLIEGSFRYDGSSAFAKGHRWGFFPSVSAGWRISEESFIKNEDALSFIDNIKIRASYGKLGDDGAAKFNWAAGYIYPDNGYVFDNQLIPGIVNKGAVNPSLTWYTSDIYNLGLDFDLWKGMLSGTVELYQRNRNGLLATRVGTIPQTTGTRMPQENLNSDMTRGWEMSLSHTNRVNDFRYTVSANLNIFRTKNKHVEQARAVNSFENWKGNQNNRWNDIRWGHVLGGQVLTEDEVRYLILHQGTSQMAQAGPGDYWHLDVDGDGWVSEWTDLMPVFTNNVPKIVYGFTVSAEYKGIDLNIVFNGAAKYAVSYEEFLRNPLVYGGSAGALDMWTDRWTQDESGQWIAGKYPRARAEWSFLPNVWDDERRIRNASYLRLKNIEVGYSLPKMLFHKIKIQKLRVYANAYNLLTFSNIKELDPEMPEQYKYPMAMNFNFGINLTF